LHPPFLFVQKRESDDFMMANKISINDSKSESNYACLYVSSIIWC
jgi:hypothetical protein